MKTLDRAFEPHNQIFHCVHVEISSAPQVKTFFILPDIIAIFPKATLLIWSMPDKMGAFPLEGFIIHRPRCR